MPQISDPSHPCGRCRFYEASLWRPVAGSDAVTQLARGFSRRELAAGEVLFAQGSDNRGVFCVSKGLIALRSHHPDGRSILLRLAYPGEIVGFRSFLGRGVHQTEARALLPSRVCTVGRRSAGRLLRDHPALLERLLERSLEEIDRSHRRIIAAATLDNKERLAALLNWLMERHGTREGVELRMRLPLSRADLADLIGVQRETMSRLVRRLEAEGTFRIDGREVRVRAPLARAGGS
ncbi:Crp/Fnr family transcriptional regulator [Celeribacter indicus]|uniref:Crp/Fnr family transcriptional regulator n=1 Tax=Celeribacter indicus TaxID=1208324 RepID=A0A0B5DXX9_9RHOB|nr:Crp/Fnr family transcriptional regulator [Celeribacter indicus]AJE45077.1 Crp/Fnr family transcriptional regulator [Celeribacter indicus]SDX42716.1 CRP/FNR family transcriptional regulator, anaerobic regulatory protein/CRP/FNR family transcriptional regulator, nitrogen fixation regulation protein [Celeribacter indicus]